MFKLKDAITDWVNQLNDKQICSEDELEELHSHLVDEIDELIDLGLSEKEAFTVAVLRIGDSDAVSEEYAKVHPPRIWLKRFSLFIMNLPAMAAAVIVAIFIFPKAHQVWSEGAPKGQVDYLMNVPLSIFEFSYSFGGLILLIVLIAMFIADKRFKGWLKYQNLPIYILTFVINGAALTAITLMAIAMTMLGAGYV